jgi:hypothetical protein
MTTQKGRKLDAATVKEAAAGRWLEILTAAGIPAAALDGKGHPCPRCGGSDRFAAHKDIAQRGAVICTNACPRAVVMDWPHPMVQGLRFPRGPAVCGRLLAHLAQRTGPRRTARTAADCGHLRLSRRRREPGLSGSAPRTQGLSAATPEARRRLALEHAGYRAPASTGCPSCWRPILRPW